MLDMELGMAVVIGAVKGEMEWTELEGVWAVSDSTSTHVGAVTVIVGEDVVAGKVVVTRGIERGIP